MNESRISPKYEEGMEQFLQFASERGRPDEDGKYWTTYESICCVMELKGIIRRVYGMVK